MAIRVTKKRINFLKSVPTVGFYRKLVQNLDDGTDVVTSPPTIDRTLKAQVTQWLLGRPVNRELGGGREQLESGIETPESEEGPDHWNPSLGRMKAKANTDNQLEHAEKSSSAQTPRTLPNNARAFIQMLEEAKAGLRPDVSTDQPCGPKASTGRASNFNGAYSAGRSILGRRTERLEEPFQRPKPAMTDNHWSVQQAKPIRGTESKVSGKSTQQKKSQPDVGGSEGRSFKAKAPAKPKTKRMPWKDLSESQVKDTALSNYC